MDDNNPKQFALLLLLLSDILLLGVLAWMVWEIVVILW